ncbi:MAG: PAS domain-containing protein [Polyangiaceae bacterium]|nr:PAS domain-containing protein [Polyangiaceae bacterium]
MYDSCPQYPMPSTGPSATAEPTSVPASALECLASAVVNALTHPVFVKDREGCFVFVNPAFAAMTGFEKEELIGKREEELLPGPEDETCRCEDDEVFAKGVPVDVREEQMTDREGRLHVLATTKVPLCGPDGEVTHLAGIIHDITHLKEQERALRIGKEELEQLVSARTEELRRTQRALLKKERLSVVGQLAAGLAHQVRNPLASITNAASVIEQRLNVGKTGDATLALSIIKEEVLAANRIISDLLDYARVRPARPIHVLLGELVETTFDARALPAGINVVRDVPDDLTAHVDGDQLRTALRNIVRNALEAMPSGGTLTIAADRWDDRVRIRVFDTGEGVPIELREQIFDPLVSSKPFGLGLGLTTARALIENQGGSLRCAPGLTAGTEMVIDLPLEPLPSDHEGFR